MPEFCTCGAELPPDSRFCHKCGKPQREEIAVEEPQAILREERIEQRGVVRVNPALN